MYIDNGFAEVNNTRLYYEVAGSGDPVLLLHGDASDHTMWDAQIEQFAQRYLVIRMDFRGFGKSAISDGSPFRHVDDVAALLDHLNIDSVHLVGQSMGGGVAIDLAIQYPQRVNGLVVVNADLSSENRLSEIKATTLILVGQHAAIPQQTTADKMRVEIPRNTKFILPNVGHMPNTEDHETFNTVALIFLKQTGCGCLGG